ncbi:hypothetical protein PAXRUDRAFT_149473, partial [Paxillus rubicundulus Ve08.2h10]
PTATKVDLPSTHGISSYLHKSFVRFIDQLKAELWSAATGCISTTTDLWSVGQTKATFLGITTHWIMVDEEALNWTLCMKVIAF